LSFCDGGAWNISEKIIVIFWKFGAVLRGLGKIHPCGENSECICGRLECCAILPGHVVKNLCDFVRVNDNRIGWKNLAVKS